MRFGTSWGEIEIGRTSLYRWSKFAAQSITSIPPPMTRTNYHDSFPYLVSQVFHLNYFEDFRHMILPLVEAVFHHRCIRPLHRCLCT